MQPGVSPVAPRGLSAVYTQPCGAGHGGGGVPGVQGCRVYPGRSHQGTRTSAYTGCLYRPGRARLGQARCQDSVRTGPEQCQNQARTTPEQCHDHHPHPTPDTRHPSPTALEVPEVFSYSVVTFRVIPLGISDLWLNLLE